MITIVNARLPFVQQIRPGLILQFRGQQAILAQRLMHGFSTQLRIKGKK